MFRVAVYATKAYRGVEVWILSFLTSAPEEVEWSTSYSSCFMPRKEP
jgi:hypothetical protein